MIHEKSISHRFAKAGITRDDLAAKITKGGGIYEVVYMKKIQNDLKNVRFDCENVTDPNDEDEEGFAMPGFVQGYDTLPNGVEVAWIGAGGDWEHPLAFCIYIGDDDELRAYIPEDGNAYNFKLKQAIGNWNSFGDEEDADEFEKFNLTYKFDMDKLRADAAEKISFK